MTKKTKAATLARKREAFVMHKQGCSVDEIARKLNLSPRMVYRYLDEYELVRLRKWKEAIDAALAVTPETATLVEFLRIVELRSKAKN